jgi:glycosyltransferase involved in cell wall biosynthesis
MNILVSHYGIFEKGGWGRTFLQARALAKTGHKVVLITSSSKNIIFINKIRIDDVTIICFPDFLPKSITSKGFGIISIILKILYVTFKKFDLLLSDTGHRPSSGWPCIWNRFLYKGIYLSEWWDFFGEGGYYDKKNLLYKLILGRYEKKVEISNKKKADGVIVLSELMKKRAIECGIEERKIKIIHGGALIDILFPRYIKKNRLINENYPTITFGYIGMADGEIEDLYPFLEAISKTKYKPNILFNTYGSSISNKYIEQFNLKGIIQEKGWVNYFKNKELLDDVDIFILVMRNNLINCSGWPNKFGDYLALGKPILITPYGDLISFINIYQPGIFEADYSEKSIEQAFANIFEHFNQNKLIEKGKKNREIAEKYLNWDVNANLIIDLYYDIKNKNIS